jgi:hypothetical protein
MALPQESTSQCIGTPRPSSSLEEHHLSAVIKIMTNNGRLALDFTPDRFHGNLLLFNSTIDRDDDVVTPEVWRPCIDGTIESHDITSKYDLMTQPGSLAQIGPILTAKLHDMTSDTLPSHPERYRDRGFLVVDEMFGPDEIEILRAGFTRDCVRLGREVAHGSALNMSPYPRTVLFITYNDATNSPRPTDSPRPEYLVGRDLRPLEPRDVSLLRLTKGTLA